MEEGHNNSTNNKDDLHAVATHPLQEEVPLTASGMSEMHEPQQQQQQQPNSKVNWVKFDDDVNEIGERNNNSSNNSFGGTDAAAVISAVDSLSATRVTAAAAAAESAAAPNRLSPLPPPPATATTTRARPRTPTESKQQQQPPEQDRSALAAPVPVQRTATAALPDVAPAVLNTESTHVNLNASGRSQQLQQQQQPQQQQHQKFKASNVHAQLPTHHNSNNGGTAQQQQPNNTSSPTTTAMTSSVTIPVESTGPPMRTIELSTGRIREGFANGDVIVTLLPANTKWPWITPAIFRPELVPEELMAQGLTLTVEDYVNAMETLVNDYRFTVYNICYKRILVCWIFFAFAVLLTLLFSGLQGVALFSLGVGWLFLNAAAIFLCMWVKLRLARGLEKCLARVNRQLMKHKILLVLDDRGRISCHKVNLCFMYFDAALCVSFLNEFLEQTEQNGGEAIKAGWEAKLDIDLDDIVIQGTNPVRLSRKQERGMQLFLRYGARWGMEALRGLVDVTPLEPGRHCGQFQCPCQYIKEHLQCKPRGKWKCLSIIYWVLASERYEY